MKRAILFFLALILLSGCFIIIKDDDKVKVFGESKETALDTLKKTEERKPEDKLEIHLFGK